LSVGGHPLALGVLIPGLVVPALFFTCLAVYPLADRRIVGGRPPRGPRRSRPGTLLPPTPADLANRTAIGVAGLTFYGLLWAAAANDQIAYHLHLDLYMVTWIFRVLVLAGPALAFLLTRVISHALADRRRDEERRGRQTGRIVMNPQGGYDEVREPAHRAVPPSADPTGLSAPAASAANSSRPIPGAARTGSTAHTGKIGAVTDTRPA
jgi:ubiquinol-cytochrome c reductase cytochrome b subunit